MGMRDSLQWFDGRAMLVLAACCGLVACGGGDTSQTSSAPASATAADGLGAVAKVGVAALLERVKPVFAPLSVPADPGRESAEQARIDLGRTLYYEPRLSKNQDISCNSCHQLDRFGVDGEPTSPGHKGQRGSRNSPTSLNAALHIAQFWDGRAADVEEQAKGPVLNPVEMAMASADQVLAVLHSIPGYGPMFEAAFPGEAEPMTYDNVARAIGAFERRLLTPSRFDRFLSGDVTALNDEELQGLALFTDTGCITCHNGVAIGGGMFQRVGLVNPYETADAGRFAVTGQEADRLAFKVPSLRNVAETGPWFHDGSVTSLENAVQLMGHHQLGKDLDDQQIALLAVFLRSLTGTVDMDYVKAPALLPGGPDTPQPDPG